jgi:4-hydroxy-tetrahydrodipicolinate synthase
VSDGSFRGIFPYLVSPLDAAGRVNEPVLRALVEHLIASGVHGLSPLGSTGEVAYLDAEQRAEVVRITVDAAAGRVPVVAGVAAFATDDAVRRAERSATLGVDGLVVLLQTFFPLAPSAVERYFADVAAAVDVPICVYTNPSVLGEALPLDSIEVLSRIPNVRYLKDASGTTGRILSVMNRVGDRLEVFSASAHIPLLVFQLGGVGWMAGPACLIPTECVELWELSQRGAWDEALALQRRLWRVNQLFGRYSLAACVKAGLELQGFEVGAPIPPQERLPPEAIAEIAAGLAEIRGVVA